MSKIRHVIAREILDSRGIPTLEVSIETASGYIGSAKVPSGASTGEHEAIELRDNDPNRYQGKGVLKAIDNVQNTLAKALIGEEVTDQAKLDQLMIDLDDTPNKSKLGANAILGCSLAIAKAAAHTKHMPLYASIFDRHPRHLPIPMVNILNGGMHADNSLDFQEFMIRPVGAKGFAHAMQMSAEIFMMLKQLLKQDGHITSVGDEGGFAPNLQTHEQALEYICRAVEKANYKLKDEITIALDTASSFMYSSDMNCYIDKKKFLAKETYNKKSNDEFIDYLKLLSEKFPIDSIEDGLDENDWEGWIKLQKLLGGKIQLVGDDLFVTNPEFLQRGIDKKAANAILIKLNQIGTLTETLQTIDLAKKHGFNAIISHRSGETEDTFIADLAVATESGQIKTGSVCRSERVAKYNRLMQIELDLCKDAIYGKTD